MLAPHPSRSHAVSTRSRLVSLLLACLIPALIVLMLLRLGLFTPPPKRVPAAPAVFDLSPPAPPEPQRTRNPVKAAPAGGGAPPRAAAPKVAPRPNPPPVPDTTTVETPAPPLDIIPLTREDFAAADIGRMPRHAPAANGDGGTGNAGSGTGRGDSQGAGTGPGGEILYNAEWVREPTNAELAFYFREPAPEGAWGEIACRTLPGFRVDRCQELGQNPPGSRLASGVRQAAWQFRVRPPRVGGRALVGAWVRIRITFSGPKR